MQYWSAFKPTWYAVCSWCSTRRHDSSTICDCTTTSLMHWLCVPERVQYKIAVLTFKVFHDSVPRYLGHLVAVADLPGRRALQSASTSRLVAPPIKLSAVGSRAFPVAAAKSGTVCQRPSSHRHHCRLSAVNYKLIFFNFHTLT